MKLTQTMQRVLSSDGETTAVYTAQKLEKMGLIKITALYVLRARMGVGNMPHRRERWIAQFKVLHTETE